MSAILGLLRFLPAALNIGLEVKGLIEQTTGKAIPTNGVEVFANQVLVSLPALITAGKDIKDVVTMTNNQVREMIAHERGPTDVEWGEQAARISTLEDQLDQAAKA